MSWPTIPELATAIIRGERTAEDTVTEALARIGSQADIHAVLEVSEVALERARQLDQVEPGSTKRHGALYGVPFIAKDNFLTAGTATTAASRLLEDFRSPYQATAIERLEAEGAIMVAKANLDEFAHGSSTENSAFGPTKNPHDVTRVPGGSSGGSAAAVAAGLVPFALGTDTGGSIRLPAAWCGVVGYKPTYGLVSRYGVIAMASSADVVGPMTASVSDSAYVLDCLAGRDPKDSTTIERESSYQGDAADLSGLRIGIIQEQLEAELEPAVAAAIDAVIARLKKAGATIQEVSLPLSELALAAYYVIVPAEISSNLARYDGVKYGRRAAEASSLLETYLQSRVQGFGEEPIRRIITGTYVLSSGYQDAYYKQAQKVRTQIREEFARTFENVDILLGPTAPTTAFPLGAKPDPLSMYLSDSMTTPANLAGLPALSLPINGHDLPIGLQLQAPQQADGQLLAAARAIEEVLQA